MNARQLQDQLRDLLEAVMFARDDAGDPANELAEHVAGIRRIATYDDVGLLTRDQGLVIETRDGAEFQLTIVQSRLAACDASTGDEEDER